MLGVLPSAACDWTSLLAVNGDMALWVFAGLTMAMFAITVLVLIWKHRW